MLQMQTRIEDDRSVVRHLHLQPPVEGASIYRTEDPHPAETGLSLVGEVRQAYGGSLWGVRTCVGGDDGKSSKRKEAVERNACE